MSKMKKMSRKQRAVLHKKRQRRRIILLIVEIILLFVLGAAAFAMQKLDKMQVNGVNEKKLEVYHDTGDYTNIALFGLDSREEELEGGVRSDCIMIASVNNSTKEVKVVSVYRDSFLQQEDGTYDKANAAYSYGGPEEAIALLNRNLDLDIKKYLSVDFNALADAIDCLGGIDIDVTPEEAYYVNGYCTETAKVVGRKTALLDHAGLQTFNGIQAVSYARIRYMDSDFKRTERQRIVLQKTAEKAKKASLLTLNSTIDKVLPQVSTNLSTSDFVGLASSITKYKFGETAGFPYNVETPDSIPGYEGSFVVPVGYANDVKQLHKFLFGQDDYQVSDKVTQIDSDIVYLTGISGDNSYSSDDGSQTADTGADAGYTDDQGAGSTDDTWSEDTYSEDTYGTDTYSDETYTDDTQGY